MPGSLVHDALAPELLNSTNLTTTVTGAAKQVDRPSVCQARLVVTGTVSGTSPLLDVEIEASDTSDFASKVSLGHFDGVSSTNQTRVLTIDVEHKFVRAVGTVTGTTPSFGSVKVTLEPQRFRKSKTQTA